MQEPTKQSSARIRVVPATREQEPVLANLLELYIYDFSEILPVALGQDGRFGYKGLSDYWSLPDHHPFLITVDDQLAGFVLVKKSLALCDHANGNDKQIWDIAECFVVRAHRCSGVGLIAAHQVWCQFPGPWQVRVMDINPAAKPFWQRAIDTFAGHQIDPAPINHGGKTWAVFTFESRAAGQV